MVKNIVILVLVALNISLWITSLEPNYGDLNHDGKIDIYDLSMLLSHYNKQK